MNNRIRSSAGLRNQMLNCKPFDYNNFTSKMFEDFVRQMTRQAPTYSSIMSGKTIKEYWPELYSEDLELDRNYIIKW